MNKQLLLLFFLRGASFDKYTTAAFASWCLLWGHFLHPVFYFSHFIHCPNQGTTNSGSFFLPGHCLLWYRKIQRHHLYSVWLFAAFKIANRAQAEPWCLNYNGLINVKGISDIDYDSYSLRTWISAHLNLNEIFAEKFCTSVVGLRYSNACHIFFETWAFSNSLFLGVKCWENKQWTKYGSVARIYLAQEKLTTTCCILCGVVVASISGHRLLERAFFLGRSKCTGL